MKPMSELKRECMSLPTAEIFPIYNEKGQKIESHKGVRIVETGKIAGIYRNNYEVVQHGKLFSETIEELHRLGITGEGHVSISHDGRRASLYLIFADKIIPDDEQGIKYGIKLSNSHDGSSAIKFNFYGFRLACTNQMVLRNVLSGVRMLHRGLQKEDLKEAIREMLTSVISSHDKFQEIVSKAITETFEWEAFKQLFGAWIRNRQLRYKYAEKIFKKVGISIIVTKDKTGNEPDKIDFVAEEGFTLNKWKIYNAFTDFLSHETKLRYSAKEWLEVLSERVLFAPVTVLQ